MDKEKKKEAEKKLLKFKKEINSLFIERAQTFITATMLAYHIGKLLNKSKGIVKNILGEKWEPYLAKNYPHIEERKARRYMSIARSLNIEKMPGLGIVPTSDLESMIAFSKKQKKPIIELIDLYKLDVTEIPKDKASVINLKKGVKEMLKDLMDGSGWLLADDIESLSYEKGKALERAKRNSERREHQINKRQNMMSAQYLTRSIELATTKLSNNLEVLFSQTIEIVTSEEEQLYIDTEELKNLRSLINKCIKKYKNS